MCGSPLYKQHLELIHTMGNLLSSCCEKDDYTEIKDQEIVHVPAAASAASAANPAGVVEGEGSEFQTVQKDEEHEGKEIYDQTSSPFKGLMIDLKFTSKSSYEEKFVWLNSYSNTIHMSQTVSKDRRHKEASLQDVTSLVAGPPNKCKGLTPAHEQVCLTINLKRGGGIDLKFGSEEVRDLWYETLLKLTVAV